ncbi:transposable element P transposase [Elysia marginata]|uniref:Transposable element P transposase n=1 Tax=Elysia marginata TaxID=1093978 RepID=A0AAV4I2J4_9GAST|nr:transposable element P transposase [Elysia marginata]
MFLLYDSVHNLKNIRNNWLTEATQQLSYPTEFQETEEGEIKGTNFVDAKWSDLRDPKKHEDITLFKLSKLTTESLSHTSIQKQNVKLVLNVFL